jgi:hypothetical protein
MASRRRSGALARRIGTLGGLQWIHAADADAAPDAEHRLEGTEPVALDDDLLVLFAGQALFSGDHLWWGVDPPG